MTMAICAVAKLFPKRDAHTRSMRGFTVNIFERPGWSLPFSLIEVPAGMTASIERSPQRRNTRDKTTGAVRQQIAAMGSELFEVGLYDPDPGASEPIMIPRIWDSETIVKSVAWLRHQNSEGRNIYIRPKGEHYLSMVDDLTKDAVATMRQAGFNPALVVETSPGNYQAWLRHPE